MLMEAGRTPMTMAGSGVLTRVQLTIIQNGLPIVTVIGSGVLHTVGPGLVMSPGVGRRITTAGGSITTTIGPGVRAANTTGVAVGGARLWLHFTSLLGTSVGIHSPTTIAIRDRDITTGRPIG